MADGTMPDIAVVDSSDFRFFHNMKHFADLTGKLEVLPEYLPQAMEPCEIDGRVYGIPFGMNCPALIWMRQAALFLQPGRNSAIRRSVPQTNPTTGLQWQEYRVRKACMPFFRCCGLWEGM